MGKFSLGRLVKCCFTDRLELFLTQTVPNDYTVYKCFTQLFQLDRDIYPHLVICVFFKVLPLFVENCSEKPAEVYILLPSLLNN